MEPLDRIERLKTLRKSNLLAAALGALPKPILRARIDCLIYFHVTLFGNWRTRLRGPDGRPLEKRVVKISVCSEQRLGYPSHSRVSAAVRRVCRICPDENRGYKLTFRRFKEARRRYMATETKRTWIFYTRTNPRRSVAYKSHLARFRRTDAFVDGYLKYTIDQLLPRKKERTRAAAEMGEALAAMENDRQAIFYKMGVPPPFRTLV